jgi:predicted dehydrogenase
MTIAIIGTGWGARVQIPAMRSAGLAVTALAGHDAAKTARIAGELGIPFTTGDWRAVLDRPDVQLVSVVTPPNTHAAIAIAALAAGKHVLCEKPTALNAAEAAQMLAAAEAAQVRAAAESRPGQLTLIDHELRFLPALILARRMIAEGAIGTPRYVVWVNMGSGRSDPKRAWNWWADAAQGGGLLGAAASHQVDTLRYLLGAEVTSATAQLDVLIPERPGPDGPRPVTADDTYSLNLTFAGGLHAAIVCSAVVRTSEPESLTLYGAEGTLRWTGGHLWRAAPPSGMQTSGAAFEDITPPHVYDALPGLSGEFARATLYMAHALRAYLEGDKTALGSAATFVDGLRTQEVLDAARQASKGGG